MARSRNTRRAGRLTTLGALLALVTAAAGAVAAPALAAGDEGSGVAVDFSDAAYDPAAPHAPAGQNGWFRYARTGDGNGWDFGIDPEANALRLSNADYHTRVIPQLAGPKLPGAAWAGEASTGAEYDTFQASFTIASATGGYQDGLNAEVDVTGWETAPPESRAGGSMIFRHVDGQHLEIGYRYQAPGAGTVSDWRWGRVLVDPTVPHAITFTVVFVDGADNDVATVEIDGDPALTLTGTSWENYHDNVGGKQRVNTLLFRANDSVPVGDAGEFTNNVFPTAEQSEALRGSGFLFSDISYGAFDQPLAFTAADPVVTEQGGVYTAAVDVTPAPAALSYQWLRNGQPIDGATGASYTRVLKTDLGATLSVRATAELEGYETWVGESAGVVVPGPSPTDRDPAETTPGAPPAAPTAPLPASEQMLPPEVELPASTPVHTPAPAVGELRTVTIELGPSFANAWYYVVVYSEPTVIGWQWVDASGVLTFAVPQGLSSAEPHTVALLNAAGSVVAHVSGVVLPEAAADGVPIAGVDNLPDAVRLANTGAGSPGGLLAAASGAAMLGAGLVLDARRRTARAAR